MLRLADIMTKDVVSVTPEMTLREAAELFTSRHVSGAPVMRGSTVVGVVSATDLLRFSASTPGVPTERTDQTEWRDFTEQTEAVAAEQEEVPSLSYFTDMWLDDDADVTQRMATVGGTELDVLDEHTVDEVMTRELCSLSPHDDVLTAAELMRERAIHRVLILERERLVGIVSASDIVRAAADHKLIVRTYVFNSDRDFGAHRSRPPTDRRA